MKIFVSHFLLIDLSSFLGAIYLISADRSPTFILQSWSHPDSRVHQLLRYLTFSIWSYPWYVMLSSDLMFLIDEPLLMFSKVPMTVVFWTVNRGYSLGLFCCCWGSFSRMLGPSRYSKFKTMMDWQIMSLFIMWHNRTGTLSPLKFSSDWTICSLLHRGVQFL